MRFMADGHGSSSNSGGPHKRSISPSGFPRCAAERLTQVMCAGGRVLQRWFSDYSNLGARQALKPLWGVITIFNQQIAEQESRHDFRFDGEQCRDFVQARTWHMALVAQLWTLTWPARRSTWFGSVTSSERGMKLPEQDHRCMEIPGSICRGGSGNSILGRWKSARGATVDWL